MGIIVKPLVTEKMTKMSEKSNRFGFIVRPDANKLEIKSAIEAMYNVTVVDVNTMVYSGKNKTRYTKSGILKGRTNTFKKAIVTLKELSFNNFTFTPVSNFLKLFICCDIRFVYITHIFNFLYSVSNIHLYPPACILIFSCLQTRNILLYDIFVCLYASVAP